MSRDPEPFDIAVKMVMAMALVFIALEMIDLRDAVRAIAQHGCATSSPQASAAA